MLTACPLAAILCIQQKALKTWGSDQEQRQNPLPLVSNDVQQGYNKAGKRRVFLHLPLPRCMYLVLHNSEVYRGLIRRAQGWVVLIKMAQG